MRPFKRRIALTLAGLAACGLALAAFANQPVPQNSPTAAPQADVPPPPDFKADSWVLMDYATGRVLASKNPDKRVEPASITKIMTDYVVSAQLQAGAVDLDDKVHISKNAWRKGGASTDGSTSFLKVGSNVSLKNLLYGLIVQSGNDAAIALAEHVAGSEGGFVSLMNQQTQRLGMDNTHYANVSGYPVDNHYSTARDTAILSRALIRNYPDDYAISAVKKFTWNGITQHNRNNLLWRDDSVDGIKTGHTEAAGYCLAASAKRNGRRLIAVVMGTPSAEARVDDAEALLNYGYHYYQTNELYAAGQKLAAPRLWKGASNHLAIGLKNDLTVTLKRGSYDDLQASIDLPATLIAPFDQGEKVGTLVLKRNGKKLLTRDVVALKGVDEGGFFSRLWDSIMLWFHNSDGQTTVTPGDST